MLVQLSRPKDRLRDDRERAKLEKRLLRDTGRAIRDHGLIENGDRILVGMSGGKDSYTMIRMLSLLQKKAPVKFELVGVCIDQGYRGFRVDVVEDWLTDNHYEHHIETSEFAEIIEAHVPEDGTGCSLCARLRRGVLYGLAPKLRCNKIALGHHADDIIETLMLNLFFNGQLKAMPIHLTSDAGDNTVIRPLGYCREDDIRAYAKAMEFPVISCACKHCGDTSMQRQQVKAMLREMDRKNPGLKTSMMSALQCVKPRHLLDRDLVKRLGPPPHPEQAPPHPERAQPAPPHPERAQRVEGLAERES